MVMTVAVGDDAWRAGDLNSVNIGIMYAQNMRPDGPVTWAFAEVADRTLR